MLNQLNTFLMGRFKNPDDYTLIDDIDSIQIVTKVGVTYETLEGLNALFPIRAIYVEPNDSLNRELIIILKNVKQERGRKTGTSSTGN